MHEFYARGNIGWGGAVASKKVTVKVTGKDEPKVKVVDYSFGTQTYQIDPDRQKVYRRFVEIETRRACTIYASWRASNA
jgi:hypothetical protein